MTSKLTFRARTLDASRPMAIFNVEDLPELTDLNAINRSVPAMPSGMEKEEESEKHLQDILDAQQSNQKVDEAKVLVIPTPEVFGTSASLYRRGYKTPRQYIHVQPFSMDAEKPDYDLDEEDIKYVKDVLKGQKKFEIDETTFEEMIDRLEKNSGHSVITSKEAKLLLKEDDDLILAVYDYWVEKRLRIKQPLLPSVKSDKRDIAQNQPSTPSLNSSGAIQTPGVIAGGSGSVMGSSATANISNANPYICFRRRTEKMQTRKNRKNDEASYEKMLKLRRDLSRAVVLLEMVKRREKTKKESLTLGAEIFEKRFQSGDFDGKIFAELQAQKAPRVLQPTQYFSNRFTETWLANHNRQNFYSKKSNKKRKKSGGNMLYTSYSTTPFQSDDDGFSGTGMSSDYEDDPLDARFAFRRKANVQYLAPIKTDEMMEDDLPDFNVFVPNPKESRYRYSYASLSTPRSRFLGRVRRRVGRGGRIVLDRLASNDLINSEESCVRESLPHFRPVTPPLAKEDDEFLLPLEGALFPSKPVRVPFSTSVVERQRSISGVKTVSVDSVGAQNAASALVTNDLMDIFGK